jgi:hypothetical protein
MWNGNVMHNCKNPSGNKRKSDGTTMQSTQRNSNGKENKTKIPAAQFETSRQERQVYKSGKTFRAGVALTGDPEVTTTAIRKANVQCKQCGHNDHQRKSNAPFPFFQVNLHYRSTGTHMLEDTVLVANTPKRYMCSIKCGQLRFAMPCRSGQSNGCK